MSDLTAIEIALDVEASLLSDAAHAPFSGPYEPRVCLVAAFALSSQLKRIVAAIHRAVPAHPPPGLRMAPPAARSPSSAAPRALSVEPMLLLLRLQSRLIRAIEPGLAHDENGIPIGSMHDMGEAAERYIRDFIPSKTVPVLEPQSASLGTTAIELRPIGITIYHLGHRGAPESILAHWAYARDSRGTLHLQSGP
jgi:hypothetical protein